MATKTPADGIGWGQAVVNEQSLERDAEPRLAFAEVKPQTSEAEGNSAIPAIVTVGPTVTSVAIDG